MDYAGWLITSPEEFLQLAWHYEKTAMLCVQNADWYAFRYSNPRYSKQHMEFAVSAYQKGAIAYAIANKLARRGLRHDRGYAVLRKEMI